MMVMISIPGDGAHHSVPGVVEHIAVFLGVEKHISVSSVVEEHISVSLVLGVEKHISVSLCTICTVSITSVKTEYTSQYIKHS